MREIKKVVSLIGISFLLTGCGSDGLSTMDQHVVVNVEKATKGNLAVEGVYIGQIENTEAVSVVPQVTGNVNEVNVSVGDTVKAGQVLCQFDDTTARLSVQSAQIGVENANQSLANAQTSLEGAQISGDATLGSNQHLNDFKTQRNIDSLQKSLDEQYDKIGDYERSMDAAVNNASTSVSSAQEALESAKEKYEKASSIASTYATVIVAYENAVDGDTLPDRTDLDNELSAAGLSFDDVTQSGLSSLQSAYESAQTAYNTAKTAYDSAVAARSDTSTLESMHKAKDSTAESLYDAKKTQEIQNKEVLEDTKKTVDNKNKAAQNGVSAAEIGIKSAENNLASAQYQLSKYAVTTPIDGVVEAVNVENNNFFASGQVGFVISNPDSRRAVFHVPDNVVSEFTEGQAVKVTSNSKEFEGAITEIGVATDETGLFQVKATVYDAMELADGVNIHISTVINDSKDEVIVPTDAIYFEKNKPYVYVAEGDKAARKEIEIDVYGEEQVSVSSGLKAGDTIITTWSGSLGDGALITIKEDKKSDKASDKASDAKTTEKASDKEKADGGKK